MEYCCFAGTASMHMENNVGTQVDIWVLRSLKIIMQVFLTPVDVRLDVLVRLRSESPIRTFSLPWCMLDDMPMPSSARAQAG